MFFQNWAVFVLLLLCPWRSPIHIVDRNPLLDPRFADILPQFWELSFPPLECLLMHMFLVGVQSHLFIYVSSAAFALGSWASLVVQMVKNLPAMQDTPV